MSGGNMERVLRLMSEKGASDVYLSANTPILIKINGQILQLSDQPLTHTQPRQLLAEVLSPSQLEELDDTGELNVGVGLAGVGSFRSFSASISICFRSASSFCARACSCDSRSIILPTSSSSLSSTSFAFVSSCTVFCG